MTIPVSIRGDRIVKPARESPDAPPSVPLAPFDAVTYDINLSVVFFFKAPTVANESVIDSLAEILVDFREWAGRIGSDDRTGRPVIILNDEGVRLVEAWSEYTLEQAAQEWPLVDLHLVDDENTKWLLQVQLTRFSCGGLALGLTANHAVTDGYGTCLTWVTWGRAARGMGPLHRPLHSRDLITPRDPPAPVVDHYGREYYHPHYLSSYPAPTVLDKVSVQRAHFSKDFITLLKETTSCSAGTKYSTFECVMALLWRAVTRARQLRDEIVTRVRISVNGRGRLKPAPPEGYFGNLVLWAFPTARAGEIARGSLGHVAGIIHEALAKVDDSYFRSFMDFTEQHKGEELRPTADMNQLVMNPDLEVDSWLRFPFHEVDFGSGGPFAFTPSWPPYEGTVVVVPPLKMDGGVDALVALFHEHLTLFKDACHDLYP